LGIFENVFVDLIAPPELQMPDTYMQKLQQKDYIKSVRVFSSIDEYLDRNQRNSKAPFKGAMDSYPYTFPNDFDSANENQNPTAYGVSRIWYFTRLQLERMSAEIQNKSKELRYSVAFREEQLKLLPQRLCKGSDLVLARDAQLRGENSAEGQTPYVV
jgi:aspartate carbamoyltransferase